jgi:hypothetical protein
VHVRKLTWGNQWTTAFSLAGKVTVVAEKRSNRSTLQVPFPHQLNTPYIQNLHVTLYIHFQTFSVYWAYIPLTQAAWRPFYQCLCNNTIFCFLVTCNLGSIPNNIEIKIATFSNGFNTTARQRISTTAVLNCLNLGFLLFWSFCINSYLKYLNGD